MSNAHSDLALQLALALGLASLTVAAGLILQVISMRLQGVRRERETQAVLARWRPVLARAALGEADRIELPPVARRDRMELLVMWNQLQEGVRGSAHDGLNHLAERLGLHDQARRFVRRRGLADRVMGVVTLGHLGHPEDAGLLREALGDVQTLISLGAARALLQIDAEAAVPLVIDQYLRRSDWPAARLGTLLRNAGAPAVEPPLTALLLAGDTEVQLRLLPLLRFAQTPHAGGVLHTLVERSNDPQVLSITLRQLRDPAALPRVRSLAGHADALVRSAAAVALGRIGGDAERPLLLALMSDADWWVRYRAAQAQLNLPGQTPAGLDALRESLNDRFARDALDHVRAEQAMRAGIAAPPSAPEALAA